MRADSSTSVLECQPGTWMSTACHASTRDTCRGMYRNEGPVLQGCHAGMSLLAALQMIHPDTHQAQSCLLCSANHCRCHWLRAAGARHPIICLSWKDLDAKLGLGVLSLLKEEKKLFRAHGAPSVSIIRSLDDCLACRGVKSESAGRAIWVTHPWPTRR